MDMNYLLGVMILKHHFRILLIVQYPIALDLGICQFLTLQIILQRLHGHLLVAKLLGNIQWMMA